jgi:hypothetical protein
MKPTGAAILVSRGMNVLQAAPAAYPYRSTSGDASVADIQNITSATFVAMPEAEQRAFVIGVANGRGMTSGLFEAYAGAAQDMAGSSDEREAIAASYQAIRGMMEPLLTLDAASLLNGIRAACRRPEMRDRLVIEALASVHVDAARALREFREQSSG